MLMGGQARTPIGVSGNFNLFNFQKFLNSSQQFIASSIPVEITLIFILIIEQFETNRKYLTLVGIGKYHRHWSKWISCSALQSEQSKN
jgi:hypothetical protein